MAKAHKPTAVVHSAAELKFASCDLRAARRWGEERLRGFLWRAGLAGNFAVTDNGVVKATRKIGRIIRHPANDWSSKIHGSNLE